MRTIEIKLYKFEELSKEAQQKTLEKLAYINVEHHDWFDCTYDDIKNLGMTCNGFDLGRGSSIELRINNSLYEIAKNIVGAWGECEDRTICEDFIREWDNLVYKHSDKINTELVSEDNQEDFDIEADVLESNFQHSLENIFFNTLKNEYEYLTSEEAIGETIIANEYEFTKEGGDIY